MKTRKYIWILLLLPFLVGFIMRGGLILQEEDGSPKKVVRTIKVTNGTLTENADGSFSLSIRDSAKITEHEYGGLETNASAYSGLLAISGGATSEVDSLSELEAQIAGVTAFVVEGTACSDIEGDHLFISGETLNASISGNMDGDLAMNDYSITGVGSVSGLYALQLPTDTLAKYLTQEGDVFWDSDDHLLVIHAPSVSGVTNAYGKPLLIDKDFVIDTPDGVNDEMYLFHVDADIYPHGIYIHSVSITLPSDAAYTLPFEDWNGDPPTFYLAIASATTGASDAYKKVEGTSIGSRDVHAGHYIYVDIPSTDVDWVAGKALFYVKHGA